MNQQDEQNLILEFLQAYPDQFSSRIRSNRPDPTSESGKEQIRKIIQAAQGKERLPSKPSTIPDEVVSLILRDYFDIPQEKLEGIKKEHQLSMAAENIVGELLEEYIASISRRHNVGWVRAYGDVIKSVDFLKKNGAGWDLFQIKNRDNSENSSSQSVREGTEIKKWFRSFSNTGKTNWPEFPDTKLKDILTEKDFQSYVSCYLKRHKS